MRASFECTLPGGWLDSSGRRRRNAVVTALGGREEELLAVADSARAPALVTELLCRCVSRIGDASPITAGVARELLAADRNYLLLKIRAATFGERVQATVRCAWPDCGAPADVDFSLADAPIRPLENPGPLYSLKLEEAVEFADGAPPLEEIQFRLPTGADQESIAALLDDNEAAALLELFGACIQPQNGRTGADIARALSPRAKLALEQRMLAIAPDVDLSLDLACPECGRSYAAPFAIQDFFFGEAAINRELLLREVHYLAYHYHWSENEILNFPRPRRREYIDTLRGELEALNEAHVD